MEIVKQDQNLMVIKDRGIPAFIAGIVFSLIGFLIILEYVFFTDKSPLWLGFVFILLGGFVLIISKTTTIILNKSTNKFIFLQKSLLTHSKKNMS